MTCDVFEKHPFGGAFPDNPGDLWPDVPGIIGTTALSSGAERLARIARYVARHITGFMRSVELCRVAAVLVE